MRKNTTYTKFFLVFFLALTALLVFNTLYLAGTGKHLLSQSDVAYYAKEVRSETEKIIKADRGNIYSFDGDLIATDRTSYNVTVYLSKDRPGYADQITYVDKPELTADILSRYITSWSRDEILETVTSENLYQYTFKAYLSSVQMDNLQQDIAENDLNGIEFSKTASRSYQYKHFSSYIIGLVNLNDDDPDHVLRNGAFGLELAYDDVLNGTDGKKVYQADINGHAIYHARLSETAAVNGSDLYLSLDSELQNVLEVQIDNTMTKLGAKAMWCGIMDAHTGRMMAMVSRPDFDLQDRSTLTNYQDLFLNNTYEVGSVIKPFVYLTAIDSGVYDGDELYQSGTVYVDGAPGTPAIQDYNSGAGWGMIPYDEGLIHSSNTAITRLLQEKMDFDDVVNAFDKLGFFQAHLIDGLDSAGGWASYIDTESPFDMVTMCFGQSASYSPYQILRAFSVFANDGKIVEPYLVDHIIDSNGQTTYSATPKYTDPVFSKAAVEHVRELLYQVVNNQDIGTGRAYGMDDLAVFGKTGTGQVWDTDLNAYSETEYCYSFVGGAPADDPQVLIFIGCQGKEDEPNSAEMAEVVKTMLPQALAKLNVTTTSQSAAKITDYTIGSFVNQSVDYAKKRLDAAGVKYMVIGDGKVVKRQTPEGNTDISTANTVYLLSDAGSYALPDFTGWSRKDIASYMQLFDISVSFNGTGKAKSQSVEAGTDIGDITTLTIELSE